MQNNQTPLSVSNNNNADRIIQKATEAAFISTPSLGFLRVISVEVTEEFPYVYCMDEDTWNEYTLYTNDIPEGTLLYKLVAF